MPLCYRLLSCLYMRCRLANLRARIFWVCRFFNLAYQKKADFFRPPLMPHAPAPRPWRLHPWDYWRPLFVMHTHLLWLRHCRPSWHTTSTIWWRRRSVLSFCIAANIFISVLRWATFERSTVITWGGSHRRIRKSNLCQDSLTHLKWQVLFNSMCPGISIPAVPHIS